MRSIRTAILTVLSALCCYGCTMAEDDRNCPKTNSMTLTFSLLDKAGDEVFLDRIGTTDLLLFDASGVFHSHMSIPTASLDASRSVVLTLDAGTYTAVAWSNLNGRVNLCDIGSITTPDDGSVSCSSDESGDPVYYGACEATGLTRVFNPNHELISFSVPARGEASETIRFVHAHKKLDIYVKGYSVNNGLPVVQVDGNHPGYDFYMNHTAGAPLTFRQPTVRTTVEGETMANAVFYTSRIRQDNNDIYIRIINPETHAAVYGAPLNDIIDSFTDFDLETEITIPILFEFVAGRFEISLPPWGTEASKPGVN